MTNKKKIIDILTWCSVILLVVSLFLGSSCITVGTYMFSAIDNDKLAASSYSGQASGIVTEVSKEEYYSVVNYTVEKDGKEYELSQKIDIYTDSIGEGATVEVFFDAEHPDNDYIIPELYVPYYTWVGKLLLKLGFGISLAAVIIVVVVRFVVKKLKMKGYSEY